MKAAVIDRYGGPEVLRFGDMPDPSVGSGEVLVRVAAASVNPVDTLDRSGGTKDWRPLAFPAIIGWDVAGTVTAIGPDVTGFAVGDRVMSWAFHTYAELVAVRAELLAKVPDGVNLVDAAALPLAAITGIQLITVGSGLDRGQTILISGAVGAVGRAAVYAAKEMGGHVIAGVRTSQVTEASRLDADETVQLDNKDSL